MELRVSTEVEPAVFEEAALADVGARVVHHVHTGWVSVEVDAARLEELRHCRGVVAILPVPSCDDRLDRLPGDLTWEALAEGNAFDQVAMRLEVGRVGGRAAALRLSAEALQLCFVRCHRTTGLDMVVSRPDLRAAGGRAVLARHSDGLRDHSRAGMHDWPAGTKRSIVMWVGHLPPGPASVEAGFTGGWIRVQGRPRPFTFTAELALG